jgi:methionine-rich copper-binding protein CopC
MGYGLRPARALLVAAITLGLTAPVAIAHTEVTSTSPKAGAYAKRTLSKAQVRFNQPIRSGTLRVLRAGKKVSAGSGRRSPANVRAIEARLEDELAAGTYVARWTMTAADGHTQKGSWRFKVRPQPASEATPTSTPAETPTATPTASPEPQGTEAASAPAEDEGGGTGLLVGGVVLLGVLAAGGLVAVRRRSAHT